jgi:hypothetical protein
MRVPRESEFASQGTGGQEQEADGRSTEKVKSAARARRSTSLLVPPGNYRLHVFLSGFKPANR